MYIPPPPIPSPSSLPPSTQSGVQGSHQKPGTRIRQLSSQRGEVLSHTCFHRYKNTLSPYSLKNQNNPEARTFLCSLTGVKVLWLPEGKQASRAFSLTSCPDPRDPSPCSAQEPSTFHDHPHGVYSKGKRKRSKKSEWVRAQGPTPTPLQATPSRLLGKQGGPRPRGMIPISGSVQRLLVFSITANAFHPSPATPDWGRGCTLSTY